VAQRRFERIVDAVASQPAGPLVGRLCTAAAAGLDTPGVSMSLASGDGLLETVAGTPVGRDGDTLQSDLGEGPAHDAHRFDWPVLVDDLEADRTWPAFGPAAVAIDLRAIFAFPIRRGTVRIGALTLSRRVPGGLSDEQHADALVFARLALDLVLALQSENAPEELDERFIDGTANTAVIHQATGIVAVQLGVSVTAALSVLRAHAFAKERSLSNVSDDVVARRLRLDDDHQDPNHQDPNHQHPDQERRA
jgi:hypothetical protein